MTTDSVKSPQRLVESLSKGNFQVSNQLVKGMESVDAFSKILGIQMETGGASRPASGQNRPTSTAENDRLRGKDLPEPPNAENSHSRRRADAESRANETNRAKQRDSLNRNQQARDPEPTERTTPAKPTSGEQSVRKGESHKNQDETQVPDTAAEVNMEQGPPPVAVEQALATEIKNPQQVLDEKHRLASGQLEEAQLEDGKAEAFALEKEAKEKEANESSQEDALVDDQVILASELPTGGANQIPEQSYDSVRETIASAAKAEGPATESSVIAPKLDKTQANQVARESFTGQVEETQTETSSAPAKMAESALDLKTDQAKAKLGNQFIHEPTKISETIKDAELDAVDAKGLELVKGAITDKAAGKVALDLPALTPVQERLAALAKTLDRAAEKGTTAPVREPNKNAIESLKSVFDQRGSEAPVRRGAEVSRPIQAQINLPFQSREWPTEFGQRLVMMVATKIQSAQIHLNPKHLGPIDVKVSMQQDQAQVTFNSHVPQTREAIEQALPRLREMMEQNGLDLGNVDVRDQNANHSEHEKKSQQGNQASADGTVEVDESSEAQSVAVPVGLIDYYA